MKCFYCNKNFNITPLSKWDCGTFRSKNFCSRECVFKSTGIFLRDTRTQEEKAEHLLKRLDYKLDLLLNLEEKEK